MSAFLKVFSVVVLLAGSVRAQQDQTTIVRGNTIPLISGVVGTQGSVIFLGAGGIFAQNNAQFFWDNTNNRLGLGTTSPANLLSVVASASISSTTAVLSVSSTNSTAMFSAFGGGYVRNGTYEAASDSEFAWLGLDSGNSVRSNWVVSPIGVNSQGVNNSAFLRLRAGASGSSAVDYLTLGSGRSGDTIARMIFYNGASRRLDVDSAATDGGTLTIIASFLAGGNVGIGSTAPAAVLDVASATNGTGAYPVPRRSQATLQSATPTATGMVVQITTTPFDFYVATGTAAGAWQNMRNGTAP